MKAEQQQSPEYPTGTDTGREVTNRVGGRAGSTRKMTRGENGHGNRLGGICLGLKERKHCGCWPGEDDHGMAVNINITKAMQTSREREKRWGRFQLEMFYLIHSVVGF